MKRLFDFSLAIILILVLLIPTLFLSLIVILTSRGNVFYWSRRVGINNKIFKMPKFRTMKINTPEVASNLIKNPHEFLTPFGGMLRRSSLDEIPQLICILKGEMSFVGPRPALYNQEDLIKLRTIHGVDKIIPGLTGWSQINGRDNLTIEEKVNLDVEYLNKRSFLFDLKIIFLTAFKTINRDNISH